MVLFNYNGSLALEAKWLWENDVISCENYKVCVYRKKITVLRRPAPGYSTLISYESLPYNIKTKTDEKLKELGELPNTNMITSQEKQTQTSFFEGYIKSDAAAMDFFGKQNLTEEKKQEYYLNAQILNALRDLLIDRLNSRKAANQPTGKRSGLFTSVLNDLKKLDRKNYPHTLPLSLRNLKPKYEQYINQGYKCLLHGNSDNDNARKVTDKLEQLFLSIAAMHNNPYVLWVQQMYIEFLKGKKRIYNTDTGEIYNRDEFKDEKGDYLEVSDSTVRNYLNNPLNKAIIQKIRNSYHSFNHLYSPHTMRHAPEYSLSWISIDDRDLPRNLKGGGHVYAYYAFDVMSGALIGAAYSREKDTNLLLDCLRDMYRNLEKMGLSWPLGIETEHHLSSNLKDTIFKPGNLFSMVRYCAPTNSQEKHAEHRIRRKKYGFEKLNQENIGRHYARLEANKAHGERAYNEQTHEYEYKFKAYSFEQLVEEDMKANQLYNESLHPDQDNHAGETLIEALKNHVNLDAWEIDKKRIYYWLGNKTETTIRRNQYINLQYKKYWLSSPNILSKLKPNDYEVTACWMYDENGVASMEQRN